MFGLHALMAGAQCAASIAKAIEGGAVGTDITLDRLTAYVGSVRPNEAHPFVGFGDENRLLAHSGPTLMFKPPGAEGGGLPLVATVSDLSDPIIGRVVRIFKQRGPFSLVRFRAADTDCLATVVRQVARHGGVFFVLYAAPL